MKITTFYNQMTGAWAGTNRLWRNWLPTPESDSPSQLSVNPVVKGKFLSLTYTWSLEGEEHEGILLIGNDNETEEVSGAWGDSWHQGSTLMPLSGLVNETNEIVLNGTFNASPEQDWGWRITLSQPTPLELQFEMHVIPWNEPEELAVQANYTR